MKRAIWLIAGLLIAMPLFAQEEGGGGGLPSSLFGGDSPIGRGNEANPMEAVKKFLAQSKVTLSGDQERTLRPMIEAAFKQVQDTVEKLSPQPAGGGERGFRGGGQQGERRGGRGGGEGRGGEGRGGRGGGRGDGAGATAANPQLAAELQKINDDVLAKIVAVMKPDQQAAFKKWQNDEIKKGGGFPALKIVMEEAGAPLTPEQEPQVQALYKEDAQQRAQLARQAQGQLDPAKVSELELATMTKVAKLLTAAQRKALLASRAK
jgi:hypothetical protein